MSTKGLLLMNLGTPSSPSKPAIRKYLKPFLSDPRVIDIPVFFRYLLLYGVILPFRPKKIIDAYQSIWTPKGSPLLVNTQNLCEQVKKILGPEYQVEFAMRYGEPSYQEVLAKLKSCDEVTVIPLYPQYATSSTGSTLSAIFQEASRMLDPVRLRFTPAFYDQPFFIDAVTSKIRHSLESTSFSPDHLLMSYHGIPQRHLLKSGCERANKQCDTKPCALEKDKNSHICYRQQCFITSRLIATNLKTEAYSVSFQSRLGKTPWIKPYTDLYVEELYQKGVRKLAVVSPSFVSDCLETIEEIGMRLKEQWLAKEKTEFLHIECVNDSDIFSAGLSEWLTTLGS